MGELSGGNLGYNPVHTFEKISVILSCENLSLIYNKRIKIQNWLIFASHSFLAAELEACPRALCSIVCRAHRAPCTPPIKRCARWAADG
jgi:hypothetical protein